MLIELEAEIQTEVCVRVCEHMCAEMRMLEVGGLGKMKKASLKAGLCLWKQASVSERNLRMFTTKDQREVSMKERDSTEIN